MNTETVVQEGLGWVVQWSIPVLWMALILVIGVVLGLVAAAIARRWTLRASRPLGAARAGLLSRIVSWSALGAVLMVALSLTGLPLDSALTWFAGAAGILGVAVGFASQTSAANIISGLFLVGEGPFEEGDIIEVQGISGVVMAVDLLSVKLRTFDNTFVRVPNELVMKNPIVNISRFPIRRMDITLRMRPGVALKELLRVAETVAATEEHVLLEPSPGVTFVALVEGGVEMKFTAWARREIFANGKAAFSLALLAELDRAGIDVIGSRREVVSTTR